jgi:hypothetical protein
LRGPAGTSGAQPVNSKGPETLRDADAQAARGPPGDGFESKYAVHHRGHQGRRRPGLVTAHPGTVSRIAIQHLIKGPNVPLRDQPRNRRQALHRVLGLARYRVCHRRPPGEQWPHSPRVVTPRGVSRTIDGDHAESPGRRKARLGQLLQHLVPAGRTIDTQRNRDGGQRGQLRLEPSGRVTMECEAPIRQAERFEGGNRVALLCAQPCHPLRVDALCDSGEPPQGVDPAGGYVRGHRAAAEWSHFDPAMTDPIVLGEPVAVAVARGHER